MCMTACREFGRAILTYPILTKKKSNAAVIPALNGGLNLRDALSNVNDNQLTDCLNVWFKDGLLQTRPGGVKREIDRALSMRVYSIQKHDVFSSVGQLVTVCAKHQTDETTYSVEISMYWCGDTVQSTPEITLYTGSNPTQYSYFILQYNNDLYCFVDDYRVFYCDLSANTWRWVAVADSEFYIPTVLINYQSTGYKSTSKNTVMPTGTQLEGYSLLSPYYKMIGSSYNEKRDIKVFQLTHSLKGCAGKLLKVDHTKEDGTIYHHTAVIVEDEYGNVSGTESHELGDFLTLQIISDMSFHFLNAGSPGGVWTFYSESYVPNNFEILAPFNLTNTERDRVFKMTKSAWFGGSISGLNGGTRVFLGGNTETGNANLVIWSDVNNPLYFDENNYFHVGTSATPVTQFGRQSDMLVIFKPNETFYTKYERNENINAEDLINQTVVDYPANSVYFPLTLINGSIGCDCPGTVQLCRNRLVWLNSDGKVYSFVYSNVYNERTIYEVGEMVYNGLRDYDPGDLKLAVSSDWQDYYLLFVGSGDSRRVYVMDYNSSGYQYPYSFNKSEDANKSIPWFRWQLPVVPAQCVVFGQHMGVFSTENDIGTDENYYSVYSRDSITDDLADNTGIVYQQDPIPVMLQTKLFDFLQGYRKNIETVRLSVGNNGGYPLRITYVTDCGTEEDEFTPDNPDTDLQGTEYLTDFPLFPCIRSVIRFGVRIECEVATVVNGLSIRYKFLGGAK